MINIWKASKKMKVFVIGAGSWGTALANVLADNGNQVVIYGRNKEVVEEINSCHTNKKYFEEISLNPALIATSDLSIADEFDAILLSVVSGACTDLAIEIDKYLHHKVIFINVAKGFHPVTHERLSEMIIKSVNPEHLLEYYALIGPSHAEEVVARKLTTINIVGKNQDVALELQKVFSNEYFRAYRNDDLIGCEYAAGLKNIIAIASGILYGQGFGDNAKASLMTRGLAEMSRFGLAMGGKLESFIGLCGMGDLIVTCTSVFSRNWQAGYKIGVDDSAENFWKENKSTVEGVNACKIIKEEADKLNISMPITNEVYNVLFNGKKPSDVAYDLMTRSLKQESH